jgi:sec-independent protein translocase protein TatA
MGGLSIWHWLIFLVVALLLFGGSGKISSIMGDVAKGIKSFKKGMSEDETATPAPDPFKNEEPKALNTTGAPSQAAPGAQAGAAPVNNTAQVNKVG